METIKRLHEAAKSMTFMVNNISSPTPSSSSRSSNTSSISSIFSVKVEEASSSLKVESSVHPASIATEVIYPEDSDSMIEPLMYHLRSRSYGGVCFRNACSTKNFCALCASLVIEAAVLTDLANSLHEILDSIQSSNQGMPSTDRNVLQQQLEEYSGTVSEVKTALPLILVSADSSELSNMSNVLDKIHLRCYNNQKMKAARGGIFHSLKEILRATVSKGVTSDANYCSSCIHTPVLYYPIVHRHFSQLQAHDGKGRQRLNMQFLSSLSPTIFHIPTMPASSAAGGSNYSLKIEVLFSGIRHVNGIYTATYLDRNNSEVPLHDSDTASIIFRQGLGSVSITRFFVPISLDLSIFVWAIIDGDGHSLYVACTESAVVIPPMLGWHSTSRGKLPPPTLKLSSCFLVCDIDTAKAAETAILSGDGNSPLIEECSYPRTLEVSDFSPAVDLSYHRVTDSKVHHPEASADYSHIGIRRTRPVKAQTVVAINGPYREYFEVSKTIHTATPMIVASGGGESDDASEVERRFGVYSNKLKSDLVVERNRLAQEVRTSRYSYR